MAQAVVQNLTQIQQVWAERLLQDNDFVSARKLHFSFESDPFLLQPVVTMARAL